MKPRQDVAAFETLAETLKIPRLSNVMLVTIAQTAATVCTARAYTKRLDDTQLSTNRDETYWAETKTYRSETEKRR